MHDQPSVQTTVPAHGPGDRAGERTTVSASECSDAASHLAQRGRGDERDEREHDDRARVTRSDEREDHADEGRGPRRRSEAREQAKKQETAYVVFFQMDESGYSGTSTDAYGIVLRTYVYTPKTGDLKYSDTMYQRPYYDSARVGGVRVPVPTRRVERYPSQFQLEQAARDAADRLLSRFNITPPPEQ
jgi:hypothetical protein